MSVTKERFEQGMSYEEYKTQMTRNRDRLDNNEQKVKLDAGDVAFFTNLSQPVNMLVLAEDWCGDVLNNVPVVGRLIEAGGKLNMRIFLRDQNLDIMDQYLKEGQFRSIPVFALFDANFQPVGHWIERPASVTALQAQRREKLFASDSLFANYTTSTPFGDYSEEARNRIMQEFRDFREEYRDFSDREVLRDLRNMIEKGMPQSIPLKPAYKQAAPNGAKANGASTSIRPKVTITYCAECGYEPQTLELAGALMRAFLHDLASIELVPGLDGAFDVKVNDDLVHSMYRDGGFPENEAMIQAVRQRIAG